MLISSFDILFRVIDASLSQSDVETLLQYLAPRGVLLLLYSKLSRSHFRSLNVDLILV